MLLGGCCAGGLQALCPWPLVLQLTGVLGGPQAAETAKALAEVRASYERLMSRWAPVQWVDKAAVDAVPCCAGAENAPSAIRPSCLSVGLPCMQVPRAAIRCTGCEEHVLV